MDFPSSASSSRTLRSSFVKRQGEELEYGSQHKQIKLEKQEDKMDSTQRIHCIVNESRDSGLTGHMPPYSGNIHHEPRQSPMRSSTSNFVTGSCREDATRYFKSAMTVSHDAGLPEAAVTRDDRDKYIPDSMDSDPYPESPLRNSQPTVAGIFDGGGGLLETTINQGHQNENLRSDKDSDINRESATRSHSPTSGVSHKRRLSEATLSQDEPRNEFGSGKDSSPSPQVTDNVSHDAGPHEAIRDEDHQNEADSIAEVANARSTWVNTVKSIFTIGENQIGILEDRNKSLVDRIKILEYKNKSQEDTIKALDADIRHFKVESIENKKHEPHGPDPPEICQKIASLEKKIAEKDTMIEKLRDALQDKTADILRSQSIRQTCGTLGDLDDTVSKAWTALAYHVRNVANSKFRGHPFTKTANNDQRQLFEKVSRRWDSFLKDGQLKALFIESAIWTKLLYEILGRPEIIFHGMMGGSVAEMRELYTDKFLQEREAERLAGKKDPASRPSTETSERFRDWRTKTGAWLRFVIGGMNNKESWYFSPSQCEKMGTGMANIFSKYSMIERDHDQLRKQFTIIVDLSTQLAYWMVVADAEYVVSMSGKRTPSSGRTFEFDSSVMEVILDTTDELQSSSGKGEFAIRPALLRYGDWEGKGANRDVLCAGEVCI